MKTREKSRSERVIPAGIVIRGTAETETKPVISAFIWGGKVRPVPTLPYGRWKPSTV